MHNLDLDLYDGPRSNVNMLIVSPYMTLLLATVMLTTSVVSLKIFNVEMYMALILILTLTFKMG